MSPIHSPSPNRLRLASRLVLSAFWLLAGLGAGSVLADGPVNVQCPVQPEETVVEGLSLHYGKHEIGFCCEHCQGLFLDDPEAYLGELPPAVAEAVRAVHSPQPEGFDLRQHSDLVLLGVLLLLAVLAWRRDSEAGRRWALGLMAIGLLFVAGLSWWRAETLSDELESTSRELELERWKALIHNNTYYDFGDPPRPVRPPVEPRLEATFYRGNDERNERLFNGGNYLTSYLDLAIVDDGGQPIEYGQDVEKTPLALRFQIRRGPNTPDFFWSDEILGSIFLTANGDPFLGYEAPVADRRDLETLEPMARWQAHYPLGRIFGRGEEQIETVIYVADAWLENGRMIGASFHYGIEVRLAFVDGVVQPASEVYMGALFRPRKSPLWRVPPEEWLSHEPLLPLPEPQGDDPETLGIDDYLDGAG